MHQSIATIDSPEFINLQPLELNPLMSRCEIKVLYLGQNRNHSYITKEVATEMSKTLRGAPIVGYFKSDKQDFADHGEKITLDDEGFKFECMTKPYGFVSPDAKVWFQKFEDYDDFGNSITREYLMTTGYLWTGQFEECQAVVDSGKPQSMELDESTLDGRWSEDTKTGIEFFIINDAIFSKLCILGDDVEPCFEGAAVQAPTVSSSFSLDNAFKNTLFSMMQDLKKFALQEKEGGNQMENVEETVIDNEQEEDVSLEEAAVNIEETENDAAPEESFTEVSEPETEELENENEQDPIAVDEEESINTQHELEDSEELNNLKTEFTVLKDKYTALELKYNELVAFKLAIDNEKKDALINSFYMLSDEDKKDVIENKEKYSYDDIEAKLSVICVHKKVNFDLDNSDKNNNNKEESPIVTFNVTDNENSIPAYVSALLNARKQNNNN